MRTPAATLAMTKSTVSPVFHLGVGAWWTLKSYIPAVQQERWACGEDLHSVQHRTGNRSFPEAQVIHPYSDLWGHAI